MPLYLGERDRAALLALIDEQRELVALALRDDLAGGAELGRREERAAMIEALEVQRDGKLRRTSSASDYCDGYHDAIGDATKFLRRRGDSEPLPHQRQQQEIERLRGKLREVRAAMAPLRESPPPGTPVEEAILTVRSVLADVTRIVREALEGQPS